MRMLVPGAFACTALLCPHQALAEPNCMARALSDVPAMEAPEQVRSKANASFGPVTQIKVNKSSGRMYYCAHDTYCYDSNAFELTTPCRIKLDKAYGSGGLFVYFTR